jgi:hypothetical protein
MKIFIAALFVIACAAAADMPDKQAMIKGLTAKINSWTGSVDELKADIAKNIQTDSGTYTLAEVNQFVDALCAGWTYSQWKCDDFRAYVVEQKKKFGKIQ